MKKFSKRLLTLLITVSMLMSTVVLFATTSAASSSDPWILSTNNVSTVPTEGSAGTAFSIPVRVTNNTGFWAMAVRLSYDDTVLQFMGVERGTIHFCAKCDDNGNFSSIDPVATAGNGAGTTSFSQVVGLGKSLSCLGELVDDGTLFSANFRVRANQPDGTITSIIASVVDINGYAENETNPTNIVVHYDAPNGVDTGFIPVDATAVVSIEDAPEPIGAVAFTVAAPVTDGNPATPPAVTAIPAGAPYTVKSATWDTSDTFFRALSPYVAEIVLEATGSNIFDENTTVAVTGGAAVVVADPIGAAGKEMTIKRTFTTGTCCPTGACPCDMEMPETCPHHVSTNVITRDIEFVLALSGDTWRHQQAGGGVGCPGYADPDPWSDTGYVCNPATCLLSPSWNEDNNDLPSSSNFQAGELYVFKAVVSDIVAPAGYGDVTAEAFNIQIYSRLSATPWWWTGAQGNPDADTGVLSLECDFSPTGGTGTPTANGVQVTVDDPDAFTMAVPGDKITVTVKYSYAIKGEEIECTQCQPVFTHSPACAANAACRCTECHPVIPDVCEHTNRRTTNCTMCVDCDATGLGRTCTAAAPCDAHRGGDTPGGPDLPIGPGGPSRPGDRTPAGIDEPGGIFDDPSRDPSREPGTGGGSSDLEPQGSKLGDFATLEELLAAGLNPSIGDYVTVGGVRYTWDGTNWIEGYLPGTEQNPPTAVALSFAGAILAAGAATATAIRRRRK